MMSKAKLSLLAFFLVFWVVFSPNALAQGNLGTLLTLVKEPDQQVRVLAARGLREFVATDPATRSELIDLAEDTRESLEVRVEAIKGLSRHASSDITRSLKGLMDRRQPLAEVRATALKAAFFTAIGDNSIRGELERVLKDRWEMSEMREAAAFGLLASVQHAGIRKTMLDILEKEQQWTALAEAVLKSLYSVVSQPDVWPELLDLVKDEAVPVETRVVTLHTLQGVNVVSDVETYLKQVAQYANHSGMQHAAIEALSPVLNESRIHFFRLWNYQGVIRDPFDLE